MSGSDIVLTERRHLYEITEIVMGQSPKGEDVNDEGCGYPLLNGPTEFSALNPIPTQFTTNGKRFAKPGDILFCVRGSTTGRMNIADQKYAIGRGIAAIRGNRQFPTSYVKTVIEANLPRLLQAATGSTFPNVSKDLLLNFEVDCLSPQLAQEVSHIVTTLDDKIEVNRQINATLEQLAQSIFKSWFVDFDPTKAKQAALVNGGTPEDAERAAMRVISGKTDAQLDAFQATQPDNYNELAATAALFPAALQDSELGEIPEGWEVVLLGDLLTLQRGFDLIAVATPLPECANLVRCLSVAYYGVDSYLCRSIEGLRNGS